MNVRRLTAGDVLAAAFLALVVLVRTTQQLLDGDVWWHLRAGETILATGSVPTVDSWTIAGAGLRWTSQDWLSNVVIAAVYGLDDSWGATVLSLLFGLAATAGFVLLWSAIGRRRPDASSVGRALFLTLGLIVAAPVLGVRVQSLDVLLIAATVWVLWQYLAEWRLRWLIALPVLTAVWANVHAAWPLLFALTGAVLVGEALDRVLGRAPAAPPLTWSQLARLAVSLVASGLALLLNPNGVALLTYPFATASIEAHREFLFEWSPPDITTFPGIVLVAFVLFVILPTLLVGFRQLRAAEMFWIGGLSILALSAIRFVLAAGPVGAAVACVALAPAFANHPSLRRASSIARRLDRSPTSRALGRANAVLVALMVTLGATIAVVNVRPEAQRAAITESMPVDAAEWLRLHRPASRIFNVYSWGGYLGRELPESLVYIDGRSDIYGDGPIREFAAAIGLETDPLALFERDGIDTVVYWPDSALAETLDAAPGWAAAYDDTVARVWVRDEGG